MKNQNGITLIALVITIIVLIILAGVAIAMLSGDNGILSRASDAKVKNAIGAGKEAVSLAVNEGMAAYYDAVYGGSATADSGTATQASYIKTEIEKIGTNKDSAYKVTIAAKSGDTAPYIITVAYVDGDSTSNAETIELNADGTFANTWTPAT